MPTQITRRGLFRGLLAAAGLAAARCYAPRALAAVAVAPAAWTAEQIVAKFESLFFYGNTEPDDDLFAGFELDDNGRLVINSKRPGLCTAEIESGWAR